MREIFIPMKGQEALGLLSRGVLLAGGTELLRLGSPEDRNLIDLRHVVSNDIAKEEGYVRIGAAVTFEEALSSPVVPCYLKKALSSMASLQLRGQATLAGNVAAMRDDSYILPSLIASGSELEVLTSSGLERMRVAEYLEKRPSGVILSILAHDVEVFVRSFRLTSHSHAVVTGAVSSEAEGYAVKGSGIFTDADSIEYVSDMYGSSEYKKYLVSLIREEGGR